MSETVTVYRVMRQYRLIGCEADEPVVMWEGTDVAALAERYPRGTHRTDELWPTFGTSDFDQFTWFERKTESGYERCGDPRPKTGN